MPALLAPASFVVGRVTAARVARTGWAAPVPVICCGNATVGGAGKTTLALDVAARLVARGRAVHLLTRGYGGSVRGGHRVDPARDDAASVGDEALLLAAVAPVWVGEDRAETAHAAVAAGADVLVMDDGLQNPGLAKTLSMLVIDGASGFGNGRVMPAGPLREPPERAAARAGAAVLIGEDACGALALLPAGLPILRAALRPDPDVAALLGQRVVAFAGIGRPEKFFAMLEGAGVEVVARLAFADHHVFTEAELAAVLRRAESEGARAVTTPKDHVRLSGAYRAEILAIGVGLAWADEPALEALLGRALARVGA